jgi:hypothetical protein
MKRTATTRVLSVLLLGACGAVGNSQSASGDLAGHKQSCGPNLPGSRRVLCLQESPFNASSTQCSEPVEKLYLVERDGGPPLTFAALGINLDAMGKKTEHPAPAVRRSFTVLHPVAIQKNHSELLGRYQYPSLLEYPSWLKKEPQYLASTSTGFMSRASYAASLVLVTRDGPGKNKINTSHLLGVLVKAAMSAAYRPYNSMARPASSATMFKSAGSTLGGDAGTNLFHEFWPGIQKMLKRAPRQSSTD